MTLVHVPVVLEPEQRRTESRPRPRPQPSPSPRAPMPKAKPRTAVRARPLLVKVHRWLSLVLSVWVLVMALSGMVLIFRSEMINLIRPELYHHTEGDVGPQAALSAGIAAHPNRVTRSVSMPGDNRGVYIVNQVDEAGKQHRLYVDPGTAKVNGDQAVDRGFVPNVKRLHRGLMMDDVLGMSGSTFVGWLALGWLFILLTGFYLWYWPGAKRWANAWRVRRNRGKLAFNLDAHKAVGITVLAPLMLVVVTGIAFPFKDPLDQWWSRFTPAAEKHVFDRTPVASAPAGRPPLSADAALRIVVERYPDADVSQIALPGPNPTGVITVALAQGATPDRGPSGRVGNLAVSLDQYSGQIVATNDPRDFPVFSQLYDGWAFGVHAGSFGGVFTKVLWELVAIASVGLAVTGAVMYAHKRNKKQARKIKPGSGGDGPAPRGPSRMRSTPRHMLPDPSPIEGRQRVSNAG
jgi:uncharacterized iron-regulated membrane protein